MKKALVLVLIMAAAAIGVVTFSTSSADEIAENKKSKKEKSEKDACCPADEMGTDEFTESSLYQLDDEWIDQNGDQFSIKELEGKPVVLTMFFASCTYACPILLNDMKKIEASLSKKDLNNYRFVLISIDPERDTPAALKNYAEIHSLDLNRWKLLSGSEDEVMELAALTGFKYKKESNGDFSHSNMITILNEDGEIEYQQVGLNADIAQSVNVLSKL